MMMDTKVNFVVEIELSKGSLVVEIGQKLSTVNTAEAKMSKCKVNFADNEAQIEVWSKQLVHMRKKGM